MRTLCNEPWERGLMLLKRLVWFHQLDQLVSYSIGSMTAKFHNIIFTRSGDIAMFTIFVTSEYPWNCEHLWQDENGNRGCFRLILGIFFDRNCFERIARGPSLLLEVSVRAANTLWMISRRHDDVIIRKIKSLKIGWNWSGMLHFVLLWCLYKF